MQHRNPKPLGENDNRQNTDLSAITSDGERSSLRNGLARQLGPARQFAPRLTKQIPVTETSLPFRIGVGQLWQLILMLVCARDWVFSFVGNGRLPLMKAKWLSLASGLRKIVWQPSQSTLTRQNLSSWVGANQCGETAVALVVHGPFRWGASQSTPAD